jgi:hypothetical protein
LNPAAEVLWLSRGEGEEHLPPSDMDRIGDVLKAYIEKASGSVVVLTGFDYLSSQNGFQPVLRLVQFLRDVAEEEGGHLLISMNPRSFEERQVSLLEGEAQAVVKPAAEVHEAPPAPQSPVATMIGYLDTLEREAKKQPLLIALDDIQWADPDSMRAFQFLARNVWTLPVVLLATLRNDDVRTPEEQKELYLTGITDAMIDEGTARSILLEGITLEDSVELVEGMTGLPLRNGAEDPVLQDILRRTGGNTFFVQETLRQLASEGYLHRQDDGLLLTLPGAGVDQRVPHIPESIRRLVSMRIDRLKPEERELLGWASVAGSEFDLAPLEGVLPDRRASIEPTLRVLERRERLLEIREEVNGEKKWAFMHPLVWEVTFSGLAERERREMASRLAEWWARDRPGDTDTIARLYYDARDPKEGPPWVRKAIERAVKEGSPENVERYHRWLQELLEAGQADSATRVREGLSIIDLIRDRFGGTAPVMNILRALEALGPDGELRWEVDVNLVIGLKATSPNKAKATLGRLRAEMKGAGALSPHLLSLVGLAEIGVAINEGRVADIEREATRVLTLGKELTPKMRNRMLYFSGAAFARMGRVKEAGERLAELRASVAATGSERASSVIPDLECFIAELTGRVADLRRAADTCLVQARASGTSLSIATSLRNLLSATLTQGDVEETRRLAMELRKHCTRFHFEMWENLEPYVEGIIALREGRWTEAEAQLTKSIETMVKQEDEEHLQDARICLSEAHLGAMDLVHARETLALIGPSGELGSSLLPWYTMTEGWLEALEKHPEVSAQRFEQAVAQAHSVGNVFNEGLARNHLARWEEAFGDPQKAAALRAEASSLFDTSGILPTAWARKWPPAFAPPA